MKFYWIAKMKIISFVYGNIVATISTYTLSSLLLQKRVIFHPDGHSRNASIGFVIKGLRYYNTVAPLNALPMNASGACNIRANLMNAINKRDRRNLAVPFYCDNLMDVFYAMLFLFCDKSLKIFCKIEIFFQEFLCGLHGRVPIIKFRAQCLDLYPFIHGHFPVDH